MVPPLPPRARDPFVLTLDLATATGCADGHVRDVGPRLWTWDLAAAGKERHRKLALLHRLLTVYFTNQEVDAVFYEQPLGIGAAFEIGMAEDTVALLRGLVGVAEACASMAGVPVIQAIGVQDARKQFCGVARFPKENGKSTAKMHVMRQCRMIGWSVANDNEADAAVLWSVGCQLANPRSLASLTLQAGKRSGRGR